MANAVRKELENKYGKNKQVYISVSVKDSLLGWRAGAYQNANDNVQLFSRAN